MKWFSAKPSSFVLGAMAAFFLTAVPVTASPKSQMLKDFRVSELETALAALEARLGLAGLTLAQMDTIKSGIMVLTARLYKIEDQWRLIVNVTDDDNDGHDDHDDHGDDDNKVSGS